MDVGQVVGMAVKTAKSVIYHIPKCGGVWVKEAVRGAGLRYDRCKDKKMHHPLGLKREHAAPEVVRDEYKDGLFSFCFIRHPVGWYKSFWSYRAKTGWLDNKFPLDRLWEDEFELFVLNVLGEYPDGFVTELYRCYVEDVDYVGKQETLADDLVKALTLAGESFDEEALRRTKWRNLAARGKWGDLCVLSDETKGGIMQAEKWVTDRFYD